MFVERRADIVRPVGDASLLHAMAVREELSERWIETGGGEFDARLDLAFDGHETN